MDVPRKMLEGELHPEFVLGLNEFLDFTFGHVQSRAEQKILRPCHQ